MPLTIATWNINSVRLRIDLVGRLLAEHAPDVLCLQETKCRDEEFPLAAFRRAGYEHLAINGQKGYHGVAIASRVPFSLIERRGFCDKGDARHIAVTLDGRPPAHRAQLLRSRRRRRAGPGDQPEVRAQARLSRRDDGVVWQPTASPRATRCSSATSTSRRWSTTCGATRRC